MYDGLIDWLIGVWHLWMQRKRRKDMMVEYSLFIKTFSIKSDQTVTDGLLKSIMNLMMIILVYSMYVCMYALYCSCPGVAAIIHDNKLIHSPISVFNVCKDISDDDEYNRFKSTFDG